MPVLIPDLWPTDLSSSVQTPGAILRTQESLLEAKTDGLLRAKLATSEAEGRVTHSLMVVAPALGNYAEEILRATHARDRIYPVTLTAKCFASEDKLVLPLPVANGLRGDQRRAATPEDFIKAIGEAFRSVEVRSLLASLIARINEQEAGSAGANGHAAPPQP